MQLFQLGLRGLQIRELILDVLDQGGGVGLTPAQGRLQNPPPSPGR